MNVIVCVKRVPDTETRIRIDGSGDKIDPAGVKYIISPYDEFAVEAGAAGQRGRGRRRASTS